MKNKGKYIKIITKLNRLTKEGKVEWEKSAPPSMLETVMNPKWVDFFTTKYVNTNIGIGEARHESYSEEFDKLYWTENTVWMLLDEEGNLEYEFPGVEGLRNLLESIRYLSAGVDNAIDHLCKALDEEDD